MTILLRSFARRIGKRLSDTKKELLEHLPLFAIQNFSDPNTALEIGMGMGDHMIQNAINNPKTMFIGIEPYLNGVANAIQLAKDHHLANVKLFANDADLLLKEIPKASVTKIYVLFPDPWPKNRQQKRRFLNQTRLELLYGLLCDNGSLHFATDINTYVRDVLEYTQKLGFIMYEDQDFPIHGYLPTRYHSKAINANRQCQFLSFRKSL